MSPKNIAVFVKVGYSVHEFMQMQHTLVVTIYHSGRIYLLVKWDKFSGSPFREIIEPGEHRSFLNDAGIDFYCVWDWIKLIGAEEDAF